MGQDIFCERGRNEVIIRYWRCGKEGYIQKFCTNQTPGNGKIQFVRPVGFEGFLW